MGLAAAPSYWATAAAAVTTTTTPMAASCAATPYTYSVSAARTATGGTRRHRKLPRRQCEGRERPHCRAWLNGRRTARRCPWIGEVIRLCPDLGFVLLLGSAARDGWKRAAISSPALVPGI